MGSVALAGQSRTRQSSPEREWAIASKAVYIGNMGDADVKLSSVSDESEAVANLIEIIEH